MWDAPPASDPKEGSVIKLWATIETYGGNLQLNVKAIAPSDSPPDMFAKWTTRDVEEMWANIVHLIGEFKEPLTKYVAEELLLNRTAFIAAYKKAPAARGIHNAWFGGLLEHAWALCKLAEPTIEHYKFYMPKMSKDKVLFGLLFHDLGKVVEYDYTTPAFTYKPEGIFTPHIVLGPAWVYEQANRWWQAQGPQLYSLEEFKLERAHLMHILAAHHGQLDWGSPVVPCSAEAILVHHLDNLDTKMMHAYDKIEGKQGDIAGFSEKTYIGGQARYWMYPNLKENT